MRYLYWDDRGSDILDREAPVYLGPICLAISYALPANFEMESSQ